MRIPDSAGVRRRPRPRAIGGLQRAALPKVKVTTPKVKTALPKPQKAAAPGSKSPLPSTPAPKSSLTGIRTYDDLTNLATTQTDAELAGQIDPLQHEVGATQSREAAAQAELEKMFGELQPQINDITHLVSDNFDKTMAAEQAIFSAAGNRLNQIKQDAASEAQKVAQQVGGPVAVDKFTGAVDPSIAASGAEFAGSLLHAMGTGQAGVQSMADWAGKVFPLIRTEKEMGTRGKYEEEIAKLQDQITSLKGTRQGRINDRLNTLLTQERQYQLQQTQAKLDRAKYNLERLSTIHTLKNDDRRLALAQGQFGLDKANQRLKGKQLAADIAHMTRQDRLNAQQLGLSKQEYMLRLNKATADVQIDRERLNIQRQKNAIQMAKALANPASTKPITITRRIYYPKGSPGESAAKRAIATGKGKDFYGDPKRHQYFRIVKETMTPAEWSRRNNDGVAITNPKQMYRKLRSIGVPPKQARAAVKAQTGVTVKGK